MVISLPILKFAGILFKKNFFFSLIEIVKKVGDLDLNMTSQCIQWKNVLGRQGPDPSTMANICLKLNAKLGGINNLIHKDNRYFLFLFKPLFNLLLD